MPNGYHHLTYEQRCQLAALKASGESHANIAEILEVDRSNVYRELARNSGTNSYRHDQAHQKARERRRASTRNNVKMTPKMIEIITEKLKLKWSPEQIAGWLKKEYGQKAVSHTTIYKYIWEDKRRGGSLYKHLRHHGKKYNKQSNKAAGRGCIPNRIDISERPAIVDEKIRLGDWEADTIIGREHKGAIVSIVERCPKYTMLVKVKQKTSEEVGKALMKRLSEQRGCVHSVTVDNGKEFANHMELSEFLETKFYFARPYHSWERGLNEHTNGLVRQYLPKATYFDDVSEEEICIIENALNNRPRKILNFRTPNEVMTVHKLKMVSPYMRT